MEDVPRGQTLILCYHAISERWRSPLSVSPRRLGEQVRGFLARGYTPRTLTEAVVRPQTGKSLVITFDDAFLSVVTRGLLVLAELGVPATIYVPTGAMQDGALRVWSGIDHWVGGPWEEELRGATWAQLAGVVEAGWEVGSHTRTHPRLVGLSDERLDEELAGSRADCAAAIGAPCTSLAYPYGECDDRVAAAAARAGYSAAATLSSAPRPSGEATDPMQVPRVGVYERDDPLRLRLKTALFTQARPVWNIAQRTRSRARARGASAPSRPS